MAKIDLLPIRKKIGISQTEFAKMCGLTQRTYSRYETLGDVPYSKLHIIREACSKILPPEAIEKYFSIPAALLQFGDDNADSVAKRIERLMGTLGMRTSADLAAKTGIKHTTLQYAITTNKTPSVDILSQILRTFPEISPDWLLSGDGDMLRSNQSINVGGSISGTNVIGNHSSMNTSAPCKQCGYPDGIPQIPTNIANQPNLDVMKEYNQGTLELVKTPKVSQIGSYTMSYKVRNEAMYPDMHAGDSLALKLQDGKDVINGNVYVLDTKRGMFCRRCFEESIARHNGVIRCVATNPAFTDMFISKKDIYSVFVVVGLLRLHI